MYAWYDLIYLKLGNEQQQKKIYDSTNQKACASRNGELLTGKRKSGKLLYLDLDGVIQVHAILKMHQNVLL